MRSAGQLGPGSDRFGSDFGRAFARLEGSYLAFTDRAKACALNSPYPHPSRFAAPRRIAVRGETESASRRPATSRLVPTVDHVSQLASGVGAYGGVAAGGPQVGMPEAGLDLVDGGAVLKQAGGPVGPQRVRVAQPLGDPSRKPRLMDEFVDGLGRQRLRRLAAAMTAEAHEDRLLVEQAAAADQWVDGQPGVEGGWVSSGTSTWRSVPPLPRTNSPKCRALLRGRLRSRAVRPRSSADRRPQSPRTLSIATSRLPICERRSGTRRRLA